MAGADRLRYGSMFRDLQNNYRQGNNKYPKSLVDAKRYINTYKSHLKVVMVISQAEGMSFLTAGQETKKGQLPHHMWTLLQQMYRASQ
eukprot:12646755-Ditylum_brightwellii.AAC.1